MPATSAISADDLLDPAFLKQKSTVAPPAARHAASPTQTGSLVPSFARAMGNSVIASMDGLTLAAAARATEAIRLEKLIAELMAKLSKLQEQMNATLDEYRRGLFCSGCGKTKSEILSVGQTFPHSGQTIIRATDAQIQAKELEMQVPITRGTRELRDYQAKRSKVVEEREEALAQIEHGVLLWSTSISFENNLIEAMARAANEGFSAERSSLERQITAQKSGANKGSVNAAAQKELQRLSSAESQIGIRQVHKRRELDGLKSKAATQVSQDQDTLNTYLSRGVLSKLNVQLVTTTFVSQTAGFNGLGGLYRMGSFDKEGHDETLPNVESFITSFRNGPAADKIIGAPAVDPSINRRLKDMVRELVKCNPDEDTLCAKPARSTATGIRG